MRAHRSRPCSNSRARGGLEGARLCANLGPNREEAAMGGITAGLSAFSAEARLDRLPPEIVRRARFLLLDLVAGIVARYEVTCRIALAMPVKAHYDRGFHPTATCGAFGAAAAAGRVYGLDAEQIASALGIALSQTAVSLQFLSNGAWTKRFQVG